MILTVRNSRLLSLFLIFILILFNPAHFVGQCESAQSPVWVSFTNLLICVKCVFLAIPRYTYTGCNKHLLGLGKLDNKERHAIQISLTRIVKIQGSNYMINKRFVFFLLEWSVTSLNEFRAGLFRRCCMGVQLHFWYLGFSSTHSYSINFMVFALLWRMRACCVYEYDEQKPEESLIIF